MFIIPTSSQELALFSGRLIDWMLCLCLLSLPLSNADVCQTIMDIDIWAWQPAAAMKHITVGG